MYTVSDVFLVSMGLMGSIAKALNRLRLVLAYAGLGIVCVFCSGELVVGTCECSDSDCCCKRYSSTF